MHAILEVNEMEEKTVPAEKKDAEEDDISRNQQVALEMNLLLNQAGFK